MSIAVMTRVWGHSAAKNGPLLVLLAIADFADDQGRAYPSVKTLAKKARLSETAVHEALRALVDAAELRVEPNAGPNGVNRYTVTTPLSAPRQNQEEPLNGGAESAPGVRNPQGAESAPGCGFLDGGGADSGVKGCGIRTQTVRDPSVDPGREHDTRLDANARTAAQTPSASQAAPRPSHSRAPTAHRLPPEWSPSAELRSWAAAAFPGVNLAREIERFCDHWHAEGGAKARKIDWDLTFKNWVRREGDFLDQRQSSARASAAASRSSAGYPPSGQQQPVYSRARQRPPTL